MMMYASMYLSYILLDSINDIDNNHNNVRTSKSCKECFRELIEQLVSIPPLPEEICRKIIVEIYYEQAIFNDQAWTGMNQTLFSQLNQ